MALVTVGPLTQAAYLEGLIRVKCSLSNVRDLQLQHGLDLVLGTDLLLVIAPGMGKTVVLLVLLHYAQSIRQAGITLTVVPSKFFIEQQ
ncbi:hypothetical protein QCA50_018015, partial [Cerrena zonata]